MTTEDKAPGTTGAETVELPGMPPLPPEPVAPDTVPGKRPTTRAGRRQAAALKSAQGKAKPDAKPKQAKANPRRASLETRLTGSLTTLGTVVAATGTMVSPAVQADGVLIVAHAPGVAAALDKVAKDDPRVAAALEKMLTAGVWSGLIAALLPLMVGMAANHGAIPSSMADMLGVEPVPVEPEPDAPGVGIV